MMRFLREQAHLIVLSLTSAVILFWFWPEIQYVSLGYNDAVSHFALIRMMDHAWAHGGNITDFWMANINFGHAVFRSYQFLMHLLIWILHKTVFAGMSLPRCFNVTVALVAMAMPWTFYKGWRIFGLSRFEAVAGAIAVVLIHEEAGYGVGLTNFTFSGYGTYNQLFATMLFPLVVGYTHRMVREGTHVLAASLAYSATFMSHILTGYFLCLWVAVDLIFAVTVEKKKPRDIALPFLKFTGLCILWTGYWVFPMAQDSKLQRTSTYEAIYKWGGHGAAKMLSDFTNGIILDAGRFPVLTIMSGIGLLICLAAFFRKKSPNNLVMRKLGIQTLIWIALSFGPATWGFALNMLPLGSQVHWHRAFGVTEIALSVCAAVALSAFWKWLMQSDNSSAKASRLNFGAGACLCIALLFPCLKERYNHFYVTNTYWLKDNLSWWSEKDSGYPKALDFALKHSDARYYAGHPWNFGNELKISGTIPFYALLVQYNVENVGAIHHHQSHAETLAYSADWRNPLHDELMNVRYVGLKLGETPPSTFKEILRTRSSVLYDNGFTGGYFAVGTQAPGGCVDNNGLERSIKYYLHSPLLGHHVFPVLHVEKGCDAPPFLESAIVTAEESAKEKTSYQIHGKVEDSGKREGPSSDRHWAKVHMTEPGLLVFKMAYHPLWKALVNGKPAETVNVLPFFIGIPLQKGDFEVELGYEVSPFKRALMWISIAAFVIMCGWVIRNRFIGRKAA